MTKYTLFPRTAFGRDAAMIDQIGSATLSERPDFAIASVAERAGQGDLSPVLTGAAAVAVSEWQDGLGRTVFWSGPNQWFVLADHDRSEMLAAELKTELGDQASVTEQNDGWVVFDLQGADLTPILERLCPINLAEFGANRVQRTVIDHVGCFVLCLEPGRSYRLLCGRSFAGSFAHGIKTIMGSVAV
ncbi:Sarcosine oxidase, gamma subunit family [Pelagimonas phthalicica]|uniref:Sarcosine oxidase, gamma subunit family n=1 Tax=Pelagimonas phthalicica TaxID=1037362 RepID=A0A238JJC0_9RHOB|nr:sarcosine oxidase subunit gamma [Pelagimonas phthalicica]TDS88417.1 sarcosine oxidase subunit gamma [Pelagimonas phthalicica]SMX30503.1 Sarcosine oxidase, gamma subunit family [Pelagimonas phthalicica]